LIEVIEELKLFGAFLLLVGRELLCGNFGTGEADRH